MDRRRSKRLFNFYGDSLNLPFHKYAEEQTNRILSGDRTSDAFCFASKQDVPNVKEFAEYLVAKGVYVRVGKTTVTHPYEEEIYCFTISKKPLCGSWNPYYSLNLKEELDL